MTTIIKAKKDARILAAYLKTQGITVGNSIALEAIARVARHRNWATLVAAATREADLAPTAQSLQGSPSYVFIFEEDENCQETLYFLPRGSHLSDLERWTRYGEVRSEDRIEALGITLSPDMAVTSVHSLVPSIDEYGLPWHANAELSARWFREQLKIAAIDHPETTVRNTGDDSGARYWFEACVTSTLEEQLLAAEAFQRVVCRVFKDTGGCCLDALRSTLQQAAAATASMNGDNAQQFLRKELSGKITLQPREAKLDPLGFKVVLQQLVTEEIEILRAEACTVVIPTL